jgi:hypothetical protein
LQGLKTNCNRAFHHHASTSKQHQQNSTNNDIQQTAYASLSCDHRNSIKQIAMVMIIIEPNKTAAM